MSIPKSTLRKVFVYIAKHYNLNQEQVLQDYLNEYNNPNELTIYKYQNHELLKDCYNNLYLSDNNNNNIELIGYINSENDIIFDKLIQKTIIKPPKKPRKKRTTKKKIENNYPENG